jgi:hypothetical protein
VPGPSLDTDVEPRIRIDKCLFEWVAGRLAGMTLQDCLFRIIGSTVIPASKKFGWSAKGTSTGICTGDNFTTNPEDPNAPGWSLEDQASVVFAGCSLSALTVAAGATADIRSSQCPELNGSGAVNRRALTMPIGPTTNAPYPVTFPVPFPDTAYSVSLQLTAPPTASTSIPYVDTKTSAGFTIQNPGNNNTYDVTVIHD